MWQFTEALLRRPRAPLALIAIGVAGLAARFVLASMTLGSNDIFGWNWFATHIAQHGVGWMYRNDRDFNHPPLMGWYSVAALKLSALTGWSWFFSFKLLPIAADIGSAGLLWHVWRKRSGAALGALAFALFAWNLDSLLVSGFHGNTDCLVALLSLMACWLIEDAGKPFIAGLALGGAMNVKLIPVLLVPVLLARVKDWRAGLRVLFGLALAGVPYVPVLLTAWEPFVQKAVAYNSNFDNWGLVLFLRQAEQSSALHDVTVNSIHPLFVGFGRYVIIGSILALCAYARATRRFDAYALSSCAYGLFLVLAPGFGVQYTVYLVPVLFVQSLRWATVYSFAAGLFLAIVYYSNWDHRLPPASIFTAPFKFPGAIFGLVPWSLLIAFLVWSWRQARRQPANA
jgi:hypothetical protein